MELKNHYNVQEKLIVISEEKVQNGTVHLEVISDLYRDANAFGSTEQGIVFPSIMDYHKRILPRSIEGFYFPGLIELKDDWKILIPDNCNKVLLKGIVVHADEIFVKENGQRPIIQSYVNSPPNRWMIFTQWIAYFLIALFLSKWFAKDYEYEPLIGLIGLFAAVVLALSDEAQRNQLLSIFRISFLGKVAVIVAILIVVFLLLNLGSAPA